MRLGRSSGFTLIEMMLVVIIIGVLAAIVFPNLVGRAQRARDTSARAQVSGTFSTALDLYEQDTGSYPTTAQGLDALLKEPDGATGWKGPYLKSDQIPLDPWGRPYQYVCPGAHNKLSYDLWSQGKDGKDGNDDVANFTTEAK
jgi:general secretion pathway protein G